MLHLLRNTIQQYAWGSPDALTELYGIKAEDRKPMAELWMGAHPKAPSLVVTPEATVPLDEYIARDPRRTLGTASASETGLPFLFKILCAAKPLSIQAHPTIEQARRGFDSEQAAGIDLAAPGRNYRDANHKPELICAIRPFWGLRGFRSVREIRDEFTTVEFNKADPHLTLPEVEDELRDFFRQQLTLAPDARREIVAAAVALSRGRWPGGRPDRLPEPGDSLARYYWVLRIAEEYPGDIGVLSPLVLNVFSLQPGEATYQPAGVLHAYLHGVGAELMANSDNVLRGGMTEKHIDVDELMSVGRFRSEEPLVLTGTRAPSQTGDCSVVRYPTPFSEFAFSRIVEGSCAIPGGDATILFCHEGALRLAAGGVELDVCPGRSVFVDAAAEQVSISGSGELYCAAVPAES